MINVIYESRNFTEIEKYLMTIAPSITSMKDVADNEVISVAGVLTFEDVKESTGEVVEVMSIITPDKKVYSCQSATFKRTVTDLINLMGDKPFSLIKISGKTKSGRDFINCVLDTTDLL